jgi:UDPglucose 6-dehydrogenase
VERAAGGSVRNMTIAAFGVTFKPNTDDMRDAASLTILPLLQERGATVRVYDPQGRQHGEELLPGVTWCDSPLDAAEGADLAVVITEWNEFRALDLKALKSAMAGNTIVDLRNMYSPDDASTAGFDYTGIGR